LLNDAVDHNDLQNADRFAQQLQMSPQVSFAIISLPNFIEADAKKFDALWKVKRWQRVMPIDLGLLMDWMNENDSRLTL